MPFSRLFLDCCPFSLIYYFVCYFPRYLILRNTITSEKTKYRMVKPQEFWTSVFFKVALLLSLWVHVAPHSGEFLTKTTAAPSQEVVEYIRRNSKNKHDPKRAGAKKDVRHCICLYIDSTPTRIVTRPCDLTLQFSKRNFA